MPFRHRALAGASLLVLAAPAWAQDTSQASPINPREVVVVAPDATPGTVDAPSSHATVTADDIATRTNAVAVEDTIKYLPGLIVRKRNIGDTQAPVATRTSGLGSSARSLIYADGALLSALIGNNNGIASPRWGLVSPQEIASVDVIYGPFAAAYPGNAIGTVINITTRLPERLEATANAAVNVQTVDLYGTHGPAPSYQLGATLGDRVGPLALFASVDHVTSDAQPLSFATAAVPAATAASGTPVIGSYPALSRTGQPIVVLGATAIPHQRQERFKLKAALDLTPSIRVTYVGALFLNDTDAGVESYISQRGTGQPVYAGTVNLDGRAYTLAPSTFSSNYYDYRERHWSHSLSATGTGERFDWQAIGTLYDFAHDVQRTPTGALPAAQAGGAGTITRLDGTGWVTIDLQGTWRSDERATHAVSAGGHVDRFTLASDRYATADWRRGVDGALQLRSAGRTRTAAVWAQDAWRLADPLTLTVGGRYEWWTAYDGQNLSAAPVIATTQPRRTADRFSPKAAIAWVLDPALTLRLSYGRAFRFPTVSELYQVVTSPVPAVPDPTLRPERADSVEIAAEGHDAHGTWRVSLFGEGVRDALVSQSGPLNATTTLATFVQNVGRTRARGVEVAADRRDLVPRVDLTGSVTYADAETRDDAAFPAAVGGTLPQVPRWKATLMGTWRPVEGVSLTAAGRYASRSYGTLDNSDPVGNTFQGFYKYLVVDLRAEFRAGEHLRVGLGIDNINDDRYFLFHPFPQRVFQADVRWKL